MKIEFRPIADADRAFLYEVYASTRLEELAITGWDEVQIAAFLDMQFNAQHRYFQEIHSGADFSIILFDKRPAGRLYVACTQDEICIVDIALLTPYRNLGIGSKILRDILAEAAAANKPVRIHAERCNPAQNLYRRLGFQPIGEHGIYDLLEWAAATCDTTQAELKA